MSISTVVEQAYANYRTAEDERTAKNGMLRVIGITDRKEFKYGQSIFIEEGLVITELVVYRYDQDRIYARRLNGVRTSVSRNDAIWFSREAAVERHARNRYVT